MDYKWERVMSDGDKFLDQKKYEFVIIHISKMRDDYGDDMYASQLSESLSKWKDMWVYS